MTVAELVPHVSELSWGGRKKDWNDRYLAQVKARRVGPDAWVILDMFDAHLTRGRQWHYKYCRVCHPIARWTTDEVLKICPGLVADALRERYNLPDDQHEVWSGWFYPPKVDRDRAAGMTRSARSVRVSGLGNMPSDGVT